MKNVQAKRVLVLADKSFEADGLMTVLSNRHARPACFPGDPALGGARGRRCHLEGSEVRVEVWCLEELVAEQNKLLSRNKIKPLQTLLWPEWDLVISFGTGGSPWPQRYGGSVVVGSAVMVHSPSFVKLGVGDVDQDLDEIVSSPASAPIFKAFSTKPTLDFERLRSAKATVDEKLAIVKKLLEGKPAGGDDMPSWTRGIVWDLVQRAEIEMKFVKSPTEQHDRPVLLFGKDWLSGTSVNVGRVEDLEQAQHETFESAKRLCAKKRSLHEGVQPSAFAVASLETTHGLVRSYCGTAPFLFITGLTDRPYAPIQVKAREAHNYGAAFNAGVVASYLVERVLANAKLLSAPEPKKRRRSRA
jgi:hypothetical protein